MVQDKEHVTFQFDSIVALLVLTFWFAVTMAFTRWIASLPHPEQKFWIIACVLAILFCIGVTLAVLCYIRAGNLWGMLLCWSVTVLTIANAVVYLTGDAEVMALSTLGVLFTGLCGWTLWHARSDTGKAIRQRVARHYGRAHEVLDKRLLFIWGSARVFAGATSILLVNTMLFAVLAWNHKWFLGWLHFQMMLLASFATCIFATLILAVLTFAMDSFKMIKPYPAGQTAMNRLVAGFAIVGGLLPIWLIEHLVAGSAYARFSLFGAALAFVLWIFAMFATNRVATKIRDAANHAHSGKGKDAV